MSSSSNTTAAPTKGGLFPGYKHVEAFGPDEEYEDEVEECFVTLDLGSVDQTLVPSSSSYRLIGLDTSTPFLQLSGTVMRGRHQTLLGTELIFKEVAEEDEVPNHNNMQYFTSSERRILFREVELKPKTSDPQTAPRHPLFPISVLTPTYENNATAVSGPSSVVSLTDPVFRSTDTADKQGENETAVNNEGDSDTGSKVPASTDSQSVLPTSGIIEQAMDVDE